MKPSANLCSSDEEDLDDFKSNFYSDKGFLWYIPVAPDIEQCDDGSANGYDSKDDSQSSSTGFDFVSYKKKINKFVFKLQENHQLN